MKFFLAIISFLLAGYFFSGATRATTEFVIEGNGSDSQNSIEFESNQETSINQSNQTNATNDVDAHANTGGNNTDNGSVETGNASVWTRIQNLFNGNGAETNDCCPEGITPTPTPQVDGPQPTPTPTIYDPGEPTPTPTTTSGGGGSSSSGGGVGGAGEVLSLSAAAGESTTEILFYTLGTLCLGIGGVLMRHPKKLLA